MPKWCDEPSPSDFDRIAELVIAGTSPYDAAREFGFTLSRLKRSNRERHAEIIELGRQEQGSFAVGRLRSLAEGDDVSAVKASELLLRDAGRLTDRLEVSGIEGGPVQLEGRAVVGLADVVRLARELGQGHQAGLDAGDLGRELASAVDVLPDPAPDIDAAGALPAA